MREICDYRDYLRQRTKDTVKIVKILITIWVLTFFIGMSFAFYYYPDYQMFELYISDSGALISETQIPRYIFQTTFFIESVLFFFIGYLILSIRSNNNILLGMSFIVGSIGYILVAFPTNLDGYIHGIGANIIYIVFVLILGSLLYYIRDNHSPYFYVFLSVFILAIIFVISTLIDNAFFERTLSLAKILQKIYFTIVHITIEIFFLLGVFDKVVISENIDNDHYRQRYLEEPENQDYCLDYKEYIAIERENRKKL